MEKFEQLWEKIFRYAHDLGVYEGAVKIWLRDGKIGEDEINALNRLLKIKIGEYHNQVK
jgi:hypothetical protein